MNNMYSFENKYFDLGYQLIAGTDEVGRGPLAGPLVCAAVILDPSVEIMGLNDSKKLSEKKRALLSIEIKEKALAYSIVYIDVDVIDQINIYQASKRGMLEAIKKLNIKPDFVLSDAMPLGDIKHEAIIKGDAKSASIAAASILAKVERDAYMVELSKKYPQYGFEKHKGYPTKFHIEMLKKYGVLEIHRKSYKPVYDVLNKQMELKL
jgi:ribonuclease HII